MPESIPTQSPGKQALPKKASGGKGAGVDGGSDYERGLIRDAISNVNMTLQYQVNFGVALLGLCITALKLFPPKVQPHVISEFTITVSIPIVIGMALAFFAQDDKWFYTREIVLADADENTLHKLARNKTRLLNLAVLMHGLAILFFTLVVLKEYK